MIELKINPEFRDLLRKQTEEEHRQLLENLLADGEAYRPIITWNGYIVDGHNRWAIIQEHPEIKYRVMEKKFENEHAVKSWILDNQLKLQDGQRVVSDEERTYMIGKRNEEEKLAHGGIRGNQYTKEARSEMDHAKKGKTAQRLADEYGVGYGTVVRAEKFAKGVDAVREVSEEAANKILTGDSGATKTEVSAVTNMTTEEKKQFAEDVVSGEIKSKRKLPQTDDAHAEARERRALNARLKAINEDMAKMQPRAYTQKDLIDELKVLRDEFVGKVKQVLKERKNVVGDGEKVYQILVSCEQEIIKIEEDFIK